MMLDAGGEFRVGGSINGGGFTGISIDKNGFHFWKKGVELIGHARRLIMYRRRYARGGKK